MKHKINNLVSGKYYKFCYYNGSKLIGLSKQNYLCHAAIRDINMSTTNTLWNRKCNFSGAEYALDATPEEIAWLEHCMREDEHMTFRQFLLEFYTSKEISNYSVF